MSRLKNPEELWQILYHLDDEKTLRSLRTVNQCSLIRVCSYVAQQLWVSNAPETPKSKILRYQLKYLAEHGHFDYDRGNDE